ncbi:MAG: ABC transporter permease subunit, partial [Planctomycetaceae bacterium]|nr:ABC transporter permease subunit [Planctomycetaceae bacterium]
RTNLANLAGVPSIVYGILGLTVFVRMFGIFSPGGLVQRLTGLEIVAIHILGVRIPLPLGASVIAGALALSLMILPVIIVAAEEALRAVPPSIRHASLALGATRWQTIRHQVLPAALPGVLTGIILAASRAIGETAPLIMVGAATFLRSTPGGITRASELVTQFPRVLEAPFSEYTALTIQVYNWVKQPSDAYRHAAAAGILVLLAALVALNGLAIVIRNRFQKRLNT